MPLYSVAIHMLWSLSSLILTICVFFVTDGISSYWKSKEESILPFNNLMMPLSLEPIKKFPFLSSKMAEIELECKPFLTVI